MFCENSKADIEFPVVFDLKIIVVKTDEISTYEDELEKVLNSIGILCSNWRNKPSSKGTYISFTVNVNINSREIFDLMYVKLKELDYIKTVL